MRLTKNISLFSLIIIALAIMFSCTKEPIQEAPDASFEVENIENLKAGTPVIFNFTGAGDFITLFSGDILHEYQNYPQDNGSPVSKMTTSIVYNKQGTYTVTAVASSYGNWAEEVEQDVASEVISIVDSRSGITDYKIKSLDIVASLNNDEGKISFSMSSLLDRTSLIATFFTESPEAKVYVNDVLQISDTTENDFTDPFNYRVEAPDGSTMVYTTDITLFFPSDEKELLSFSMATPLVESVIDEATKTVTLVLPAGTNLERVRVLATSSDLSVTKMQGNTLSVDRARTVDLSVNPSIITVIAEDLSEQDYELTATLEE